MHDYHQLRVWQVARQLSLDVYRLTAALPPDERFGLTSQMRRSSVSVAANIAEGAARGPGADFRRFLRIASGSASELETEVLIAGDTGLLPCVALQPILDRIDHVRRMLIKLEQQTSPQAN